MFTTGRLRSSRIRPLIGGRATRSGLLFVLPRRSVRLPRGGIRLGGRGGNVKVLNGKLVLIIARKGRFKLIEHRVGRKVHRLGVRPHKGPEIDGIHCRLLVERPRLKRLDLGLRGLGVRVHGGRRHVSILADPAQITAKPLEGGHVRVTRHGVAKARWGNPGAAASPGYLEGSSPNPQRKGPFPPGRQKRPGKTVEVGTAGFEPATSCTPYMCATELRHVPGCRGLI